jgi:leader peptidase (prepilin peptidase)/N-methyltransferase
MLDPYLLSYAPVVAAALFGLIVGSFANVCIHRIPLEESIVFPGSRCPACRSLIPPGQNVPIVSWMILGGRCASCREPISIRYPFVEALHGIGFAALVLVFGLTHFTPFLFLLYFSLVVLAFIDWDHQFLPDVITLPGIAIGIASSQVSGALVTGGQAVLASLLGYAAFFLIALGYARLRGIEGLGQGDWKLSAMMGAFLGPRKLMLAVFLASISGMIYGLVQALRLRALAPSATNGEPSPAEAWEANALPESREGAPPVQGSQESAPSPGSDTESDVMSPDNVSIGRYRLPFGTFLAGSAIFILFFGDRVLEWYGRFFPY